ncbi:MAG: hypothetical protein JZU65_19485 [Chlorobium sp.]|jgi:chromosome segregation ATPase|nr:hypothetical protein [Chlorobium sp.]
MLQLIFTALVAALISAALTTILSSSKNKRKIEDLKTELSVAQLQVKLSKVQTETVRESWQKAFKAKDLELGEANNELLRKMAHIDQFMAEAKKKDQEISMLKTERKDMEAKLEHYKPKQGAGGRFIKKTMERIS